jgi:hypothetical protein
MVAYFDFAWVTLLASFERLDDDDLRQVLNGAGDGPART